MGLAGMADDFIGVSLCLFPDQGVDEVNRIVEMDFFALDAKAISTKRHCCALTFANSIAYP